jgi:hypothetical protein
MARIGVRAISTPKFDPKVIERAILREKRDKGREIEKQLEKTVAGWSGEKPRFKARVKDRGRDVVIEITLTGTDLAIKKWQWLDEGTKKNYPIPLSPKTGRSTLWFRSTEDDPYKASTKPRSFVSRPRPEPTGEYHAPKQVIHPGIMAREWTEMVREWMEDEFGKRIKVVLKRAVEKASK